MNDRIAVVCDGCGGKFKAKAIAAGKEIACPTCKQRIRVPELEVPVMSNGQQDFASDGFAAFGDSLKLPTEEFELPPLPSSPAALPEVPRVEVPKETPSKPRPSNKHYDVAGSKFPALHMIANIFKGIAIFTAIVALLFQVPFVIFAIASVAVGGEDGGIGGVVFAIGIVVINLIGWAMIVMIQWATAELIELFLQIERNTART